MVNGRERMSVAVKMVNDESAATHSDGMKGSTNRMVATYQLSFNGGSRAASDQVMSRRRVLSNKVQRESVMEQYGSDSPNLWQQQATQFHNEKETVKFAPKLHNGGDEQVLTINEQLERAQDEMLALYMQTAGVSGTDNNADLTLAYLAKPNRSETEPPDCGAPKSPKTSIAKASRNHSSTRDHATLRKAYAELPAERKRTPQQRQQRAEQRIPRTPPRNQMGCKAKPERSPHSDILPKAQKQKQKRFDPIEPKNTCQICTSRVYFFKTRCLVCGRLYCKNCVVKGMGAMIEGRKCKQCVGRGVNERYKDRIGKGITLSKKVREAETKASFMSILKKVRGEPSIHHNILHSSTT